MVFGHAAAKGKLDVWLVMRWPMCIFLSCKCKVVTTLTVGAILLQVSFLVDVVKLEVTVCCCCCHKQSPSGNA